MKSLFFSHDYNASDDVKILFMRQQLGMEGVGIYWYVIERLAQAGGKLPLKIVPVLSMQMQVPDVKVMAVINQFELFTVEDERFFSQRLLSNISMVTRIKDKLSDAGKKGAQKRWNNNDTPQKPDLVL
jgi:hypothetical protein